MGRRGPPASKLLRVDTPSRELGPFQLQAELGRGGMGVVYRAIQLGLARAVALKVLAPGSALDDDVRARFEAEARLAARVRHPALVQVLDFGVLAGGQAYIAYELVEGKPLSAILADGPLEREVARAVAVDVVGAMAALHEAGIVHRDLKPSNVLIGESGPARVTDLGIAVELSGHVRRTAPGVLLGTPEYLAPELLREERPTAAADVYATGVLMFLLATGRLPFQSDSVGALLRAHLEEEPPEAFSLRPDADPLLARLARAALAKQPAARPTARALLDELTREAPGAHPARRPPLATVALSRDAASARIPRVDPSGDSHTSRISRDQHPVAAAARPSPDLAPRSAPAPHAPSGGRHARSRAQRPFRRRAFAAAGALALAAGVAAGLATRAYRDRNARWQTVESPAPRASSPAPDAAPPAPRASSPAAPPTDTTPVTARWRRIANQLPELESNAGRHRDMVLNRCRRLAGIDLESPARWIYWVKLARWLEEGEPTDQQPTSDVELGSAIYTIVDAQGDTDDVVQKVARRVFEKDGVQGDGDALSFAVLCIGTDARDPRGWLLLGRSYDRDGRSSFARRAYAEALQRGAPPGSPGWVPQMWYALARALTTVPEHSLEREFWKWAPHGSPTALQGLREACAPDLYERVMRARPH